MIAVTVEPERRPSPPDLEPPPRRPAADESVLEDRVPDWAKQSRSTALLTLLCGGLFLALSYQPLWHTDLWGHLAYGRWIWTHHALPETEPLLPLCQGMPFEDTAWLSQVAGYLAQRQFGVSALQFLYAAAVTMSLALLGGMVRRRTGSLLWSAVGIVAFGCIDYQQLIVARPQLAGLACFVATLAILTARLDRWTDWILLPAVFAAWANLHGSFPMGLLLIGCFVAGRGFDLLRRTGSFRSLWRDRTLRRHFLIGELCAAAVLLNPYGLELYVSVIRIASNANLRDLIEWDPLTLRMMQGKAAAAGLLALIAVYRTSPRRISGSEAISLMVLGLGACWTSRILIWWGPVAAYSLAMHGAAVSRRWNFHWNADPRSGLWTVATAGLAWIAFAYTPFGMRIIHGPPATQAVADRQFRHAVSTGTPLDAAEYLQSNPPSGLVFNTYEWGDYLLWSGPPGLQCFVNSHAHLVPREVWEDYLRIANAVPDMQQRLARYGVNTVVIDQLKDRGSDVARVLSESPDWETGYEDGMTAVFRRKSPL